jgi:hypothetical protein
MAEEEEEELRRFRHSKIHRSAKYTAYSMCGADSTSAFSKTTSSRIDEGIPHFVVPGICVIQAAWYFPAVL